MCLVCESHTHCKETSYLCLGGRSMTVQSWLLSSQFLVISLFSWFISDSRHWFQEKSLQFPRIYFQEFVFFTGRTFLLFLSSRWKNQWIISLQQLSKLKIYIYLLNLKAPSFFAWFVRHTQCKGSCVSSFLLGSPPRNWPVFVYTPLPSTASD